MATQGELAVGHIGDRTRPRDHGATLGTAASAELRAVAAYWLGGFESDRPGRAHERGTIVLLVGGRAERHAAAETLAAGVGTDLHRFDLSRVVRKYIGEAEENLARLFDLATASDKVLFFDEADSLFATRTRIRDSHDGYANTETSCSLQRLEAHPGTVVLALNHRLNVDATLLPRCRVVVGLPQRSSTGEPRADSSRHGSCPSADMDCDPR